uniref:Uncharacterized protein n=1 Tax=Magnetococcus massalia (strain MO-1) TaxID=451514 RepID=A0A1S7LE27_MAGMO|nr:Conserved protein of unknown function [Candidatus Magnetococcus massalia]
MANRVAAASSGYNEMVANTPVMWVAVGMMLTIAFFLIGYLVQRMMQRRKHEKFIAERKAKHEAGRKRKRPPAQQPPGSPRGSRN